MTYSHFYSHLDNSAVSDPAEEGPLEDLVRDLNTN